MIYKNVDFFINHVPKFKYQLHPFKVQDKFSTFRFKK